MLQATVEQIRLAQMIYDKNDAYFEGKVNQVMNTLRNRLEEECDTLFILTQVVDIVLQMLCVET